MAAVGSVTDPSILPTPDCANDKVGHSKQARNTDPSIHTATPVIAPFFSLFDPIQCPALFDRFARAELRNARNQDPDSLMGAKFGEKTVNSAHESNRVAIFCRHD
jgi:hypothetical protein